jgi:N utilization substance protein B
MASNRHLGRIIALQTLFEQDFRRSSDDAGFSLDGVLKRNITRYQATVDDKDFVERLVRGVSAKAPELDEELQPVAPEWPIDQIARMDRVILRMGLYELKYEKDVPAKVVINEAVELAKAFGSENSSKFVNGVLGTLLRQISGDQPEEKPAAGEPADADETTDAVHDDNTNAAQDDAADADTPAGGGAA